MKVSLWQAYVMAFNLYLDGNRPFWKVLKHCLWSRKRGNELVDLGCSNDEIVEILLEEEARLFRDERA